MTPEVLCLHAAEREEYKEDKDGFALLGKKPKDEYIPMSLNPIFKSKGISASCPKCERTVQIVGLPDEVIASVRNK